MGRRRDSDADPWMGPEARSDHAGKDVESTTSSAPETPPEGPVPESSAEECIIASSPELQRGIVTRVTLRLMPFLMVCYIAAFLDRANLGNAHKQLGHTLGITEEEFGFAASAFFVSYMIFEVPSNACLRVINARHHMARIMIAWGIFSALSACVWGVWSLVAVRLLLGAAEAGFFPGIVFYLTFFFTPWERAERLAIFYAAQPLAGLIGGVASYGLLRMDGVLGLHGWQWLFIVEGVPTVGLGVLVLWLLPAGPAEAPWLSPAEAAWLVSRPGIHRRLPRRKGAGAGAGGGASRWRAAAGEIASHLSWASMRPTLASPGLWLFGAVNFFECLPMYALSFYVPAIIAEFGVHPLLANLASSIPFAAATLFMLLYARHSDQTGERMKHIVGANAIGAAGALLLAASYGLGEGDAKLAAQMAALSLLACGVWGAKPVHMSWAASESAGEGGDPAIAIALVTVCGNVAGWLAPIAMAECRARSGGYAAGLVILAASCLLSAVCAVWLRRALAPGPRAPPPAPASCFPICEEGLAVGEKQRGWTAPGSGPGRELTDEELTLPPPLPAPGSPRHRSARHGHGPDAVVV